MNSLTHNESITGEVHSRKKKKVLFMLVATFLMLGFVIFSASQLKVFASDPIKNYSFAKRATTFMGYFNRGVRPDEDGKQGGVGMLYSGFDHDQGDADATGVTSYVYPGNAGCFVSYDPDEKDGISGYIVSKLSFSSYSVSYDRYFSIPTHDTEKKKNDPNLYYHGIYYYARYGYTLSAMGIDTVSGDSNFSLGRAIAGYPILFVYLLALAVPMMFHIVLQVLISLNPFAFFLDTVRIDEIGKTTSRTATQAEFGVTNGALSTIKQNMQALYNSISDLSIWVLVPLFIGFSVAAFLLFKKNQNGDYAYQKIKKLVVRLAFLVLGLPILGSVYTSVLVKMSDVGDPGNSAATQMVLCTFVNFESWAANTRLCPPTGGKADIVSVGASVTNPVGQPSENTMGSLRTICAEINVAGGGIHGLYSVDLITGTAVSSGTDVKKWDSTSAYGHESDDNVSTSDVIDLINDFTKNSFYTSGAYESKAKAELEDAANACSKDGEASYYAIFESSNNPEDDLHTGDEGDGTQDENGGSFKVYSANILWNTTAFQKDGNGFKANPFANGGMSVSGAEGTTSPSFSSNTKSSEFWSSGQGAEAVRFLNSGSATDVSSYFTSMASIYTGGGMPSDVQDKVRRYKAQNWKYKDVPIDSQVGLSTLSMYNYLNTEFNSKEMICYSPDAASSHVRKQHHSVNLIGTGFLCFLYWLNLFLLCGGIAVMGIGYALAILFSNIRRGWQIIFNVPLATMGALQAIAKLITYTVVLVVEIIGTMFMYHIMEEFMLGVSRIVEYPFSVQMTTSIINIPTDSILTDDSLLNTTIGSGITCSNQFTVTISVSLMLMLSSAVLVWITINSFRFRKAFVKSIDEMAARVINKFITGNDAGLPSANIGGGHGRGGSGLMPALATGAAQGAMANRLNSGNKKADKSKNASANKDGGGGSGGNFKDSPGDESNKKDAQAGENATDPNEYAETQGDSAAMDTEGADNDNGHSDLEDKKAAEALEGSPTGISNSNAEVGSDNDSVANVDAGDKAVDGSSVNNIDAENDAADKATVAAGDEAVENAENNLNNAIDAANEAGGAVGDKVVQAGDEFAGGVEQAMNTPNEQGTTHNVEGGDGTIAGEAIAAMNTPLEGTSSTVNTTNNNSNKTDASSKSKSANTRNVSASSNTHNKNSATKNANSKSSTTANVKGVGTGSSGPTSKKGQKLQAKYEKKNLAQEAKKTQKRAVANQNAAIKNQTKAAIANNATKRAAQLSQAKTNEAQKRVAVQNAESRMRTAKNNYASAVASGDKNRIQAAKAQMDSAKTNLTKANQDYKIAKADTQSAQINANKGVIAAQNAGIAVKGAVQRVDNRFDVSDKASTAGRVAGNVVKTTAKTAGKVAVGAAATTLVAGAVATKKAVDFHDDIIDDSF